MADRSRPSRLFKRQRRSQADPRGVALSTSRRLVQQQRRLITATLGGCVELVQPFYRRAQLRRTQSSPRFKINSNGRSEAFAKAINVGAVRQFCRSGQSSNGFLSKTCSTSLSAISDQRSSRFDDAVLRIATYHRQPPPTRLVGAGQHLGGGVRCDGWPPGPAPSQSLSFPRTGGEDVGDVVAPALVAQTVRKTRSAARPDAPGGHGWAARGRLEVETELVHRGKG